MHKKIKHIIAVSLVLSAVCGVLPANNFALGLGSIKAYASSKDDDDDYDDEAYLEGIYLSNGDKNIDIDFDKDEYDYDVNVGNDVAQLTVKAEPEDGDYLVDINDSYVERKNDYEKIVDLKEGKNTITIYVESDDDHETYTLNVYRAEKTDENTSNKDNAKDMTNKANATSTTNVASTSNSTNTTNAASSGKQNQNFAVKSDTNKFNVWNRVDGKWRYINGTGEYLKNQWWFDKNTGINYYIDKDGNRTTGWFTNNNNWYYFNENGEMQTGWICLNKNWYYLNKSGVMQRGWLEDSAGNWYYLDNINGAMKTGWFESSDGKWYYLDTTGKMIKDSTINGYTLDKDGILTN